MILHVKEKDYTTVGSQFISPISWFSAGMHYFEAQHATVHGITKSWTRLGGNNIFLIYISHGIAHDSCFPGGSVVKNLLTNADIRDVGSIPVSGRSPGEGNGNPLQYTCLENSRDRLARWAIVHGVTKSQTRLSS